MLGVAEARRRLAQQQPGAADVAAEAARHGRRSGGQARPARQWPGAAGTPARPVRRGIQQWWSYKIHTTAAPAEDLRQSCGWFRGLESTP